MTVPTATPFRKNGQVFSGRQGLRMVFSHPNCATAFATQGSEPYGLLRLLDLKDKGLTAFPTPDTVSTRPEPAEDTVRFIP
jgi:hypothetical protein